MLDLIRIMPRSEIIGGLVFSFGFPLLFLAVWVMTP